MKVLFVTNNINVPGNGICSSVNATVKHLKDRGIDARILAGTAPGTDGPAPDFPLEKFHFPIFQPIIDANGFSYAKLTGRTMREAIEWADIVHVTEPLFLQEKAVNIARKMGKPVVGTFHLYTQNILNEIPGASWEWSNDVLMKMWNNAIFRHCSIIQCPTSAVKRLLQKHNYRSKLEVISNGIEIDEQKVIAAKPEKNPYIILNTGRYANVKSQKTLLEAMEHSKHSREIKLIFAGTGVNYDKLKKTADNLLSRGVLAFPPQFGFRTHEEISGIARQAYLYVHCATLEVEGLGCLEAIKEGCVPVIGSGDLIGTTDFALDDRSIYPAQDAKALADKIDWWIEHPAQREEAGQRYADFSRQFDINRSISAIISMYEEALGK